MDKVISSLTGNVPDEWDADEDLQYRVKKVYEDPKRVKDLVKDMRLPSVDSKAVERELEDMQREIEERKNTKS